MKARRIGVRPAKTSACLVSYLLLSLLTCFLAIGCANPGPPKPPSLHLPALVTDLAAERTGSRVLLRWTTPSRTTDDFAVKGPMTAQICRETGPRPGTPAARLSACAPILRLAVVPGPSEVADTLPAALTNDPVVLLTYRVQILNSIGRSAGDSLLAAFAASGTAPPPIEALNVTASEHGAVLEWTPSAKMTGDPVELTRTDLSASQNVSPIAPPSSPKPPKRPKAHPRSSSKSNQPEDSALKPANQTRLRTSEFALNNLAGTVDPTAALGDTYTYTVRRVRPVAIGPHNLEIASEISSTVTIVLRDTFPPRAPTGLATVPGISTARRGTPASSGPAALYIDLSWEPNTEFDLAGYFVYRQLARLNGDPQGPLARLTPSPVTTPAYRDVAVSPGQRYIYQVTAVDASGNESAPSAKAQEAVTPE